MATNYEKRDGGWVLVEGTATQVMAAVAVAWDDRTGQLLQHGEPGVVLRWFRERERDATIMVLTSARWKPEELTQLLRTRDVRPFVNAVRRRDAESDACNSLPAAPAAPPMPMVQLPIVTAGPKPPVPAIPADAIRFNSRTPKWDWLSNFSPHPVNYNGIRYPTAEHAYQAQKFDDEARRRLIANLKLPRDAKAAAPHDDELPDQWYLLDRDRVMREVLTVKFSDGLLRRRLLGTGTTALVHLAPWDDYWGTGKDERGGNRMGVILMELRERLRHESDGPPPVPLPCIGIIGTAGRGNVVIEPDRYRKMYDCARRMVRQIAADAGQVRVTLVSGGAAYADHLAVLLYLNEPDLVASLHLHLPVQFRDGRYDALRKEGGTANYYLERMKAAWAADGQPDFDPFAHITHAIAHGAIVRTYANAKGNAFFARNRAIAAQAQWLIAFTAAQDEQPPADSGTRHTWDASRLPRTRKIHVPIGAL